MLKKMQATIKENGLIAVGDTVLVALSGGPDSVALFEGLLRLRDSLSFSVCGAHLNHKLRGAESDEDERFVRSLTESRGVPLIAEARHVRRIQKTRGGSIEEVARKVRYAFLRKAARKCRASKIALGHNLDDNAETVLMNLIRGAGVKGLSGMPVCRRDGKFVIIRPLLWVTRGEILSFLGREKISYREDISNLDISLTRNRIRHHLLPLLEAEYNRGIKRVLAETSLHLREAEECIAGAMAELEKAAGCRDVGVAGRRGRVATVPPLAGLKRYAPALWREFLRRLMQERLDVSIERRTLQQVCELVTGTRTESVGLGKGLVACMEYDRLHFLSESALKPLPLEKELRIPCEVFLAELGLHVSASFLLKREANLRASPPEPLGEVWRRIRDGQAQTFEELFDTSRIRRNRIVVRTRKERDAFQPLGMRGKRKVKELFIDEKVPVTLRERIPIFCCEGEIMWIVGHRVAAKFAVKKSTQKVLRLLVKVLYCRE